MSSHIERRALQISGIDALGVAEELLGEENQRAVLAVGHALLKRKREMADALWQELRDTHHALRWEEFTQLLSENGFITVKRWRYPHIAGCGRCAEVIKPEGLIAADINRKLLLTANSYLWSNSEESLNGGMIHGAVEIKNKDWFSLPFETSCIYKDGAWVFGMDIGEGLFTKLKMIEETGGKFVNWDAMDGFIYLGNYSDADKEHYETPDFSKREVWEQHRRKQQIQVSQFLSEVPAEVKAFMQK